jgi:hypothetical protein
MANEVLSNKCREIEDIIEFIFLYSSPYGAYALSNILDQYKSEIVGVWRFAAWRENGQAEFSYAAVIELAWNRYICIVAPRSGTYGYVGTGPIASHVIEEFVEYLDQELNDVDIVEQQNRLPTNDEIREFLCREIQYKITESNNFQFKKKWESFIKDVRDKFRDQDREMEQITNA